MLTPQRYLAALMNCENDSHQTTAVLYCDTSTDGGTATMKFSKVFTSPRRTERPLTLKNDSLCLPPLGVRVGCAVSRALWDDAQRLGRCRQTGARRRPTAPR